MVFKYTGGRALTDAQIEKGIREEPTLYFKQFKYKDETVEDLVHEFFKQSWVNTTYDSKENRVCDAGRSRSFTDLYSFVLHYIPETDLGELKAVVRKILFAKQLVNGFCDDIKRSIFHYPGQNVSYNHNYNYVNDQEYNTEYNQSFGEFFK